MKRINQKQAVWILGQSKELLEQAMVEGSMPEVWKESTRHLLRQINRELDEATEAERERALAIYGG